MQNAIKKIVWACLLVIPFIVLHVADAGKFDVFSWFGVSGMFFPFISGKNLLFRIFVEIALAGWAILALYDASYRVNIKKSPIMLAYGLFMLVLLLADLFGVDREKSMWSNFERMEGFVGHIHLFAYFFVLSVMVRTLAEWRKLWKVFIVADIFVLIYGYSQMIGAKGLFFANHFPVFSAWFTSRFPIHQSQNRLDATIGNSAYFGVFCLMYVFIAAILWFQSSNPRKNWFYPALIILNVVGVLYSGTRGSMIGLAVGAFISFGLIAWKGQVKLRKTFAVVSIVFFMMIASIFVLKNTPLVQNSAVLARIATISPNDITGASRLSMWKISYEAWLERPILGYGQDNFGYVFARKFLPEKMCNLEPWYDRSHNVFFDWLVAAGLLGLLTYLSLYGVTLWALWKKQNSVPVTEKAILTGLLAGYFIHNFFVFDNLTSYILFFAVLAYATFRTRTEQPSGTRPLLSNDQMNLLVIPVIGIALVITQYYINYRPLLVNQLVIRAMSIGEYIKVMPFADAVKLQQDSFTTAIAMNTLGSNEAREQFLQIAIRMGQVKLPDTLPQGDKQAAVQAINNLLQAARKDVATSYEANKEDVRMLSIYGMFLNGIGDSVSAEQVLTEARKYAPHKQLLAFDLIRAYLIEKKYAEAYALGREVYDMSITCHDALKWYMMGAAYAGQFEAAKAYALSKGQDPGFDPDVIAGVITSGQIQVAVRILEDAKKANPANADQIDAYIKQLLAGKR